LSVVSCQLSVVSCQLSVVSCQLSVVRGNLRFANCTKIAAVWNGLCPAGASGLSPAFQPRRFSVRAILQGQDNRPERVEDWSHQPTLLLPTGNRQQTTDNCSYLRFFWRPAGRAVVMGRFPALKSRMCLAPVFTARRAKKA
jgi:hypothetical protein